MSCVVYIARGLSSDCQGDPVANHCRQVEEPQADPDPGPGGTPHNRSRPRGVDVDPRPPDRGCGGGRPLRWVGGSRAEALSRGASHVTFVERSRRALRVLERNIRALGAGVDTTVLHGDALTLLPKVDRLGYDLVLADPPYGRGYGSELVSLFGRRPFARELWIEHRIDEVLPPDISVRQRRYGDTVLTAVALPRGTDRDETRPSCSPWVKPPEHRER